MGLTPKIFLWGQALDLFNWYEIVSIAFFLSHIIDTVGLIVIEVTIPTKSMKKSDPSSFVRFGPIKA